MPKEYPLEWPADYVRTRLEARDDRRVWKKTPLQYREEIIKTLAPGGGEKPNDAKHIIISTNVHPDHLSSPQMVAQNQKRDPGVAVYFTLPPVEDFSWQDTLQINNPNPTVDEITAQYRALSRKYHTDVPGTGDIEMFKLLTEARRRATQWVTGEYDKEFQHVVACDGWNTIAWNMKAIVSMIQSIRRAKATRATGMLERMYAQMNALPEEAGKE